MSTNPAVKEIASYIVTAMRRDGFSKSHSWGLREPIEKHLQQMVDEGRIVGGIVATGDHEEDGKTVIDWDVLGPSDAITKPDRNLWHVAMYVPEGTEGQFFDWLKHTGVEIYRAWPVSGE